MPGGADPESARYRQGACRQRAGRHRRVPVPGGEGNADRAPARPMPHRHLPGAWAGRDENPRWVASGAGGRSTAAGFGLPRLGQAPKRRNCPRPEPADGAAGERSVGCPRRGGRQGLCAAG